MTTTVDLVKGNLDQYNLATDSWLNDHRQAMQCLDFEEFLRFGLTFFEFINHLDESWRHRVRRKIETYSPECHDIILELYRLWMRPCDKLIQVIERFEADGFDIEPKEVFLAACRECRGILTPDEDFFQGDQLDRLRNSATEELAAGTTEAF